MQRTVGASGIVFVILLSFVIGDICDIPEQRRYVFVRITEGYGRSDSNLTLVCFDQRANISKVDQWDNQACYSNKVLGGKPHLMFYAAGNDGDVVTVWFWSEFGSLLEERVDVVVVTYNVLNSTFTTRTLKNEQWTVEMFLNIRNEFNAFHVARESNVWFEKANDEFSLTTSGRNFIGANQTEIEKIKNYNFLQNDKNDFKAQSLLIYNDVYFVQKYRNVPPLKNLLVNFHGGLRPCLFEANYKNDAPAYFLLVELPNNAHTRLTNLEQAAEGKYAHFEFDDGDPNEGSGNENFFVVLFKPLLNVGFFVIAALILVITLSCVLIRCTCWIPSQRYERYPEKPPSSVLASRNNMTRDQIITNEKKLAESRFAMADHYENFYAKTMMMAGEAELRRESEVGDDERTGSKKSRSKSQKSRKTSKHPKAPNSNNDDKTGEHFNP